jgi:hypothetical protein
VVGCLWERNRWLGVANNRDQRLYYPGWKTVFAWKIVREEKMMIRNDKDAGIAVLSVLIFQT